MPRMRHASAFSVSAPASRAAEDRSGAVKLKCQTFGIRQTCYRYEAKLDAENKVFTM